MGNSIHNPKFIIHNCRLGLCWYHYGARYYDPQLGRWLQTDPVEEFHSPYVYCINNPVICVDPDGKRVEIYVHSGVSIYGHTAINVNGTVYSYGMYGENNERYSSNLKGEGVLYTFSEEMYIEKKLPKDTITRFNVKYTPEQEEQIVKFFEDLNANGTPHRDGGMEVDNYSVVINNCTTKTIASLPDGPLKSFLSLEDIPLGMNILLRIYDLFNDQVNEMEAIEPEE